MKKIIVLTTIIAILTTITSCRWEEQLQIEDRTKRNTRRIALRIIRPHTGYVEIIFSENDKQQQLFGEN